MTEQKILELLDLPEELILCVLARLELKELVSCTLVSQSLYRLARDPSLWKGLFVTLEPAEGVPSPRLWCSTVVVKDKMYLYGGHTTQESSNLISNVKNDLYEYDFGKKRWTMLPHQMGGKTEHKCVSYNNCLWFTGGYNGQDYTNDTYMYDPVTGQSSLVDTIGEKFSPRSALTVVIHDNKMYTFGGWNGFARKWFNDLYELNLETRCWRKVESKGDIPIQRTSHAAVVNQGKMYVFGGFSGDTYLNDLYEYDFDSETWTNLTHKTYGEAPAPRSRFCAAVHGNSMYILGGWNKVGYFEDLYSFNFSSRVWCKIENSNFEIPSISQYSLSVHNDFLYIFGGYCAKRKECVNELLLYKLPEDPSLSLSSEDSQFVEPPKKRSRDNFSVPLFEEIVTSSS